MDRCALFVDAGYALADGAMAVHGTRRRDSVSWDHAGLLKLLAGLARDRTGLPVLRCYWYEAAEDRTPEHDSLAEMPGLKLRLVSTRPGSRESVESQFRRDVVMLAKSGAIADAFIASADEHLAEMVAEVQDLGLRVVILHIASDGGWTIPQPLRQECDDIVEISGVHLRPFVDLIRGAEPTAPHEQPAPSIHGSRSGANDDGSQAGAKLQSAVAVAALASPASDFPAQLGSDYVATRPVSSADVAQQGPTPPYVDSRPAHGAGVPQPGAAHAGSMPGGTAHAAIAQEGTAQPGMEPAVRGQAEPGQFGAGPAGPGQFGAQAGPGPFGAPARAQQFGAGPGGPGQFGAQAGPAPFGSDAGGEQPGTQAHPGSDPGQSGRLADGRRGNDQFAAGAGAHGRYGSGQFGTGDDGAVRQPGGREGAGQEHSGGTEASRGTGQLAAGAPSQQQLGGAGQHAQSPHHAATTAVHQSTQGLGRPRHEYGVGQDLRSAQQEPADGGRRHGPQDAGQPPAHGMPQHAPPMPQQHATSGAYPGGTGHGGIAPRGGHDRPARDGAGYGTGPAEPAGGFQGGLGPGGPAQTAGHGDVGNLDRLAGGSHVQAGPYKNGQGADNAAGYMPGLVSYQGSHGGYQNGSGQNGSDRSAIPGYHDEQGHSGRISFGPYMAGSPLNGGAANGGPRGGEAPRPPSAGFAAAPVPGQPQPYGPPDRGYIPGHPGGFTQGPPGHASDQLARSGYQAQQPQTSGPYDQYQEAQALPAVRPAQPVAISLPEAVKAAHAEGYNFGQSVGRGAPGLWLEAVLARKPRMPSDLEARLLQGSSLPIDSLLHDEVRHSLRRGFWDALESAGR